MAVTHLAVLCAATCCSSKPNVLGRQENLSHTMVSAIYVHTSMCQRVPSLYMRLPVFMHVPCHGSCARRSISRIISVEKTDIHPWAGRYLTTLLFLILVLLCSSIISLSLDRVYCLGFCWMALCLSLCVLLSLFLQLFGGELGGPRVAKWVTAFFLLCLWVLYIALASTKAYGTLEGF